MQMWNVFHSPIGLSAFTLGDTPAGTLESKAGAVR